MKRFVKKFSMLGLALAIPASVMLTSCSDDSLDPHAGIPPGGVKKTPGASKK